MTQTHTPIHSSTHSPISSLIYKLNKLFKDDLILHTIVVFFGTTFAGVINLLYHMVSARLLTPEDYGTFNALVSFVMFTSMAITPLGTTLTRFFTGYIAKKELTILFLAVRKLVKQLILFACLIAGLFFIVSPLIAGFLNTRTVYVLVCGAIITVSLFSTPLISLLQSFQKFLAYSFLGITASSAKLLFGALFMLLGMKVLGALSGFLSGSAVIVLFAIFFIPVISRKEAGHIDRAGSLTINLLPVYKYCFPAGVIMVSFTILTTVDVVLVRHFFSPLDAGYYSIAQMVGKITLFLPSALAIVIFPKSAHAHATNTSSVRLLYKSLVIAGACCLIFTLISFLFPDLLLKVLTGRLNPVSRGLVGLFALAMSFYALTWIVINYLLATYNLKFALPILALSALEAVVIYNYHPSLTMVLYILLTFGIISLFGLFLLAKVTKKRVNE